MRKNIFLQTNRIQFSKWQYSDLNLALLLWDNPKVTKYISASGKFTKEEIKKRLAIEIKNENQFHIQYWPMFNKKSGEFIGVCGLRPYSDKVDEIGIHLRPEFWRQGYAKEAMHVIIDYAFNKLHLHALFAGHNPNNAASKVLLNSLGFVYLRNEFYEPTGLYHPSYLLTHDDYLAKNNLSSY